MTPEKETREQKLSSEILVDPEILLDKIRVLSKHPQEEAGKASFREWLLKDWEKINKFLLRFPSKRQDANGHILVRSLNLDNYRSCINQNSEVFISSLHEDAPDFFGFVGIDRTKVTLYHQSDKTKACKKCGGEDIWMDVSFIADSENRADLIGLNIKVKNDGRSGNGEFDSIREYYEVKVSPELQIKKFKPGR